MLPDELYIKVLQLKTKTKAPKGKCFVCRKNKIKAKKLGLCNSCYDRLRGTLSINDLLFFEKEKFRELPENLKAEVIDDRIELYKNKYGGEFLQDLKRVKWNCLLSLADLARRHCYSREFVRQMYLLFFGEEYTKAKKQKGKILSAFQRQAVPSPGFVNVALSILLQLGCQLRRIGKKQRMWVINNLVTRFSLRRELSHESTYYSPVRMRMSYGRKVDVTVVYAKYEDCFYVIDWRKEKTKAVYIRPGNEEIKNKWNVFLPGKGREK